MGDQLNSSSSNSARRSRHKPIEPPSPEPRSGGGHSYSSNEQQFYSHQPPPHRRFPNSPPSSPQRLNFARAFHSHQQQSYHQQEKFVGETELDFNERRTKASVFERLGGNVVSPPKRQNVCLNWMDTGACYRGHHCPYAHPPNMDILAPPHYPRTTFPANPNQQPPHHNGHGQHSIQLQPPPPRRFQYSNDTTTNEEYLERSSQCSAGTRHDHRRDQYAPPEWTHRDQPPIEKHYAGNHVDYPPQRDVATSGDRNHERTHQYDQKSGVGGGRIEKYPVQDQHKSHRHGSVEKNHDPKSRHRRNSGSVSGSTSGRAEKDATSTAGSSKNGSTKLRSHVVVTTSKTTTSSSDSGIKRNNVPISIGGSSAGVGRKPDIPPAEEEVTGHSRDFATEDAWALEKMRLELKRKLAAMDALEKTTPSSGDIRKKESDKASDASKSSSTRHGGSKNGVSTSPTKKGRYDGHHYHHTNENKRDHRSDTRSKTSYSSSKRPSSASKKDSEKSKKPKVEPPINAAERPSSAAATLVKQEKLEPISDEEVDESGAEAATPIQKSASKGDAHGQQELAQPSSQDAVEEEKADILNVEWTEALKGGGTLKSTLSNRRHRFDAAYFLPTISVCAEYVADEILNEATITAVGVGSNEVEDKKIGKDVVNRTRRTRLIDDADSMFRRGLSARTDLKMRRQLCEYP